MEAVLSKKGEKRERERKREQRMNRKKMAGTELAFFFFKIGLRLIFFPFRPCQYGFQAKYTNSPSFGNAQFFSKRPSAYDVALSQGLLNELSAYHKLIRELEEEALGPKPLSLSAIVSKLAPYKQVLPMLKRIVQARSSNITGSLQCSDEAIEDLTAKPLLTVLYSLSHCGDPQRERSIASLQSYVHRVLYRQLLAWMAYGKLQDMDGDFFIRRNNVSANESLCDVSM